MTFQNMANCRDGHPHAKNQGMDIQGYRAGYYRYPF